MKHTQVQIPVEGHSSPPSPMRYLNIPFEDADDNDDDRYGDDPSQSSTYRQKLPRSTFPVVAVVVVAVLAALVTLVHVEIGR